jgi:predicted PurR-regulated permease PerM
MARLLVRGSLAWARWAVRHPRLARLVYLAEFAAIVAVYWALLGIWAGLIAAAVIVILLNLLMTLAQRSRRKRGLPPLPPIWRDWST